MLTAENSEFGIDFSDFKVINIIGSPSSILIPKNIPLAYEKYLVASLLTLTAGNTSVDYVLKNWLSDYEEKNANKNLPQKLVIVDEIIGESKKRISTNLRRLRKIKFESGTENSFICEAVFLRLSASYKALHSLIRFGYYFESSAIIRLVLEQLSYAYAVSKIEGQKKEYISPTKSIKLLKEFIPYVGRIYGVLSKISHIDESEVQTYIDMENEKPITMHNSIDFALQASFYLTILLDVYECVFEFCFRNFLGDLHSIKKSDKGYVLKEERETKELSKSYGIKISEALKN